MASIMDKVTDFLIKNNYVVAIKAIKRGIELSLPEIKNKIFSQPAKTVKFMTKRGKNSKIVITDGTKTTIELPDYTIKYFLIYQILNTCRYIGYDYNNILIMNQVGEYIDKGIDGIEKTLKPSRGKERIKEDSLSEVISEFISSGDQETCKKLAEEAKILDGFQIILNLLQKGQIENGNEDMLTQQVQESLQSIEGQE